MFRLPVDRLALIYYDEQRSSSAGSLARFTWHAHRSVSDVIPNDFPNPCTEYRASKEKQQEPRAATTEPYCILSCDWLPNSCDAFYGGCWAAVSDILSLRRSCTSCVSGFRRLTCTPFFNPCQCFSFWEQLDMFKHEPGRHPIHWWCRWRKQRNCDLCPSWESEKDRRWINLGLTVFTLNPHMIWFQWNEMSSNREPIRVTVSNRCRWWVLHSLNVQPDSADAWKWECSVAVCKRRRSVKKRVNGVSVTGIRWERWRVSPALRE